MQKYKKWETSSVCFYSSMSEHCGSGKPDGCGSTDRREGQGRFRGIQSNGNGYLENELSVPEGCMEIVDLQVMEEESLKMLARKQ